MKSLIIFEGPMMPTKTEVRLCEKCGFDMYAVTNFSFMDIALYLGMKPCL